MGELFICMERRLYQSLLVITIPDGRKWHWSSGKDIIKVSYKDPPNANGMLFFKGWLSLLMGIRERVGGDAKWTQFFQMTGGIVNLLIMISWFKSVRCH